MLGLVLLYGSASAVEVKDLYLVKWPIAEQSKTARWKAALAGFKEVLIRKSGSQLILQSYEVQQAYSKVTRYLQSFEYSLQQDKDAEFPYTIALYFEPRLIDDIVKDAKMPLWGANRPLTILWIAVEEDFNRRILKDDTQVGILQSDTKLDSIQKDQSLSMSLKDSAIRRGLPIISPLMDLEDELVVSISDVWGRFPSTILQASQRYSADSIILGRIRKDGEQWQGNFSYLNQNIRSTFDISAEQPQQVIGQMVDKLAELLCEKYCVVEEVGKKNEVLMSVSSIYNFNKFKAAENYLNKLSAIKRTDVVKIDQHRVLFKLTLLGQVESLVEGIALSQQLQIDKQPKVQTDDNLQQTSQMDNKDNQGNTSEVLPAGDSDVDSDVDSIELAGSLPTDSIIRSKQNQLKTLYYRWLG